MNAFGYIRVSGQAQADKDGPVRQRETIKLFASAHNINVVNEFEDVMTGEAESSSRPGWTDMIETFKRLRAEDEKLPEKLRGTIRVECVIAEKIDRLGRDMLVIELLLLDCRKLGIKVLVPEFGDLDICDLDDKPERKFCRQVLGAVAQLDKGHRVGRLAQARARIRKEFGRCEGQKPWGTKVGEFETWHKIIELKRQGMSYAQVASRLNRRQHKTRHGQPWTRWTVRHILRLDLANFEIGSPE